MLHDRGEHGGEVALVRHSAGLWLCELFHDSGLMRSITVRIEGVQSGGDPTGAPVFERSRHASRALAQYQAVMQAMERRELYGIDARCRRLPRRACGARDRLLGPLALGLHRRRGKGGVRPSGGDGARGGRGGGGADES